MDFDTFFQLVTLFGLVGIWVGVALLAWVLLTEPHDSRS
jgi:hypothetical protein